jgi:hypothetical protein
MSKAYQLYDWEPTFSSNLQGASRDWNQLKLFPLHFALASLERRAVFSHKLISISEGYKRDAEMKIAILWVKKCHPHEAQPNQECE